MHGRVPGRGGGRPDRPGRHRAGAPGGGHRQVAPRGRGHRPHPRRRVLAGGLQPGRHPAGRDRDQAGRGHRRGRARRRPHLRHRTARPGPLPGRLRRADGGGVAALRRERLAFAARIQPVGHADGDQERQLAAFGPARGRIRDRAAGRGAGRRRAGHPGDQAPPRGLGHHHLRPLQGRGPGLPVLPRARPGAGRPAGRMGDADPGLAARGAVRAAGPAAGRMGPVRPRPGRAVERGRARTWSRRRSRRAPRRPTRANGGWASWPAGPTMRASSCPRWPSPRPRSPGSRSSSRPGSSTTAWPGT